MIVADGLRKTFVPRLFARPVVALAGVSVGVLAGEVVMLLGANGSGKTTLLKCLAGLVVPSGGRATVAGHDCAAGGAPLRRDAAYVPADPRSFAWRLSGRENLLFFGRLHGWGGRALRDRVDAALAAVALDGTRRVAEYSSGMRQRLSLARALLGRPRVLLLDEPTTGVDPRGADEIRALLRARRDEGVTLMWATHSFEDVAAGGDRAVVLREGRVAYDGAAAGARGAL
ncbi:MAG TPA: ABC transporter ATP-binding protein [Haliangiales bacterium]|nr:ABC transporter ATP-binding protein [Haliangiales bacterium]